MTDNHDVADLLKALEEARDLAARLQRTAAGRKEPAAARAVEDEIMGLEKAARSMMKSLGCTSPQTRAIQRGMADMLIQWYSFVDDMD